MSKLAVSEFISTVKLAGQYGFCAILVYFGYELTLANQFPSNFIGLLLIGSGVFLGFHIIQNEIEFKRQRHDAPWQFDRYKGE